ncbi:signal recognition particle-docking protein FtsY [Mycoplasma mycoides]|uniref:signal recognition particle-docking protein FtsY n=1 Tax=Mycoplasma mycoides TaxID=2102 RepID=UPI0027337ECB|nr:signal recognition particle-docking protein FtsY [Mycoplasma mycoides]MDP4040112.1 signal recognition particle-docking protein FtsY [Mycoplasma mycoides]MDP4040924.1 signal recognition particle-docking protein FtsY [Mycoplasma mycoides]MDP4041873.1 signal recognition particle-docking protein FtsY [Mycoplasma mycoides]MDP4043349.1 signal recognition particle-docking protein FtsY [Mycoplasma mycoides]MDP4044216.1 signal recognition particle-docking protein FtsY [Mycoplasma mycoides]
MGFWAKLKEKLTKKTNQVEQDEPILDQQEQQEEQEQIIEKEIEQEPVVNQDKQVEIIKEKKIKKPKTSETKKEEKQTETLKEKKKREKQKEKDKKVEKAMLKSAFNFSKDIKKLSKKYKQADDEFFEELEDVLIQTDMGMKMVLKVSNLVRKKTKRDTSFENIKDALVESLYQAYTDNDWTNKKYRIDFKENRLNIFMLVGVNGTGKTTSLAKMANYYAELGYKVLIAAADTFRAGATQQLEEWIKTRLNNKVDLVKANKLNADPASVVFDAIKKAKEQNYDLLLIDTAGRLQNKTNLMAELEKMNKIIQQVEKSAPHEVLLVIDATTGQNGVIQAEEFSKVADVSGIILTKMDSTSKGGIGLAIKELLNIPIKMIGVGEKVDDLLAFDIDQYIVHLSSGFMQGDEVEK